MSGNFLKKKTHSLNCLVLFWVFLGFFKARFMFVYVRGGAENGTLFDAK